MRSAPLVTLFLLIGCSAGGDPARGTGGAPAATGGVSSAGGVVSTGGVGASGGGPVGGTGGGMGNGGSVNGGAPPAGGTGGTTGGTPPSGGSAGASGGAGGASGGTLAGGGTGGALGGTDQGGGGATSGGGGDAGTSGSAGKSGTGVGCAGADIACDDFEAGIDSGAWRSTGLVGPEVSTARAHSGAQSALFQDEGNVGRFLAHASGFPAGGQLYFRAYMSFEKRTMDMMGHTGFIVGATADTNGNELRWGQSLAGCNAPNQLLDLNHIPSDKTICSSGHVTGGNPADHPGPGVTLEADTWYCVELYFDSSVGEFRIWIDDAELDVLHATADSWCPTGQTCEPPNPWPMPFTMVKFGTQVYNGGAGDIYYDDVALGTMRIGCE